MSKTLRILTIFLILVGISMVGVYAAQETDYAGIRYQLVDYPDGSKSAKMMSTIDGYSSADVPEKVNGYVVDNVDENFDPSNIETIHFDNWSNVADHIDFSKFTNLNRMVIAQETFGYSDSLGNFNNFPDGSILEIYGGTRLHKLVNNLIENGKNILLNTGNYGDASEFVYESEWQKQILGINKEGITDLYVPAGSVQLFKPFPYNSTNLNACDYFGMDTVQSISFYSSDPIEIYDLNRFKNLKVVKGYLGTGLKEICEKYGISFNDLSYGNIDYTGSLFEYEEIEGTNNIKITKYKPGDTGRDLEIPSEIDGKTVTCIGSDFDFDTENINRFIDIESVYIPSTVTTIENGAFRHAYVHNFVFYGNSVNVENWSSLLTFVNGTNIIDLNTNIYLNENTSIEQDLQNNVSNNYTIKSFDDVQIEFNKKNQQVVNGESGTFESLDCSYRVIPNLPIDTTLLEWSSSDENIAIYNTTSNEINLTGGIGTVTFTLDYKGKKAEMALEVLNGIGYDNIKIGCWSSSEILIGSYVYKGEPVEPHVRIKAPNGMDYLEEGKDYELSYSDNEGQGQGKVTINFIGDVKFYAKNYNEYEEKDTVDMLFYIYEEDYIRQYPESMAFFSINPIEKKVYNYGDTIVITADGYDIRDGEELVVEYLGKSITFSKESDEKYVARVLVDDSLYMDPNNYTYPLTYVPIRYHMTNMNYGSFRSVIVSFNQDDIEFTLNPKPNEEPEKAVPVYRMFNPINGEHLYTTDAHEVEIIYREQGWGKEGIAWYTKETGKPVYRLYNPRLGNHLYTSDNYEISVITKTQGWVLDFDGAPVMYADGDIPVYRLFNPGLQGQHHLTTDRNEYNVIPKWGWKQEGIAMNVLRTGVPETTHYYKK